MSDLAVDKYKDALKRVVERWKGKVEGPAKELVKERVNKPRATYTMARKPAMNVLA